jgi:hypothetical protein
MRLNCVTIDVDTTGDALVEGIEIILTKKSTAPEANIDLPCFPKQPLENQNSDKENPPVSS